MENDDSSDEEIKKQIKNFYKDLANNKELPKENIQVLIVDDEKPNLRSFKSSLRRHFDMHTANSASEAIEVLNRQKIHIIVTDERMPETTGVEFLTSIVDLYDNPIKIVLTGYADMDSAIDSINKAGVYRYMTKPWRKDEMIQVIQNAYELYFWRAQSKKLTHDLMAANKQLEFLIRQSLLDQ